ncbi:radical SAM protein, partial [Thermodesulfobacteriota bacterium]
MTQFQIKRLVSGGIITNYFCTSRCRHCLYNCSPHRGKGYIDSETGAETFRLVRRLGCTSVHIGGGEPLLRPDKLGKILQIAADSGVAVEYVETNASWFKDIESATATLSNLRRKGLRTLLVSISPFHNEFISFSRTKGVMAAAGRAGMGVFPWIDDFVTDLSRLDPDKTH